MYLLIFVAKLTEVALMTIRLVLTTKGYRIAASLIAAVEIVLWVLVTSSVILGLRDDPLRAVAFGLAYVFGTFIGIIIEDKLALGLAQIEVIAELDLAREIVSKLRSSGYGATTFDCEGLDGKKVSIELKVHRKDVPLTMKLLREYDSLFVTVTDIRKLSIGDIRRRVLPGQ